MRKIYSTFAYLEKYDLGKKQVIRRLVAVSIKHPDCLTVLL